MPRVLLLVCAVRHAASYSPQVDTFGGKSIVPANMKHLFEPPSGKEACKAVQGQMEADDDWCQNNCQMAPPNCPKNLCDCPGGNPDMSPQSPAENDARRVFAQREAQVSINDKATTEHEKDRETQEATMSEQDEERVNDANSRVKDANHRVKSLDSKRTESDEHRLQREKDVKVTERRLQVEREKILEQREREKALEASPAPNGKPDRRYDDKLRIEDTNERVAEENERVHEADLEREKRERDTAKRERILRERVARRITPSPAPGHQVNSKPLDTQCESLDGTDAGTKWCQNSCNNYPPMCPDTMCKCEDAGRVAVLMPSPAPLKAAAQPATPSSPIVQDPATAERIATRNAAETADRIATRNGEIQKAEKARKEAEQRRNALEVEQSQRALDNEQRRKREEATRLKEAEQVRKALEEKARKALDVVKRGVPPAAGVQPSPKPSPSWNIWAALRNREDRMAAMASPSPAAAPAAAPAAVLAA